MADSHIYTGYNRGRITMQEKNNTIWTIRDLKIKFDLEDIETLERYENAFEKMAEEEKKIPEDGRRSARIRAYCELFPRLFSRIFDEKTSEEIFGDVPSNVREYENIYLSFLDFVKRQSDENAENRSSRLAQYLPSGKSC